MSVDAPATYRVTGERARQMRVLSGDALKALYARSDVAGLSRLAIHVALLAAGGAACYVAAGTWWLAPAWLAQGVFVMALFAPMHECIHYTAFRTRWPNDVVGFLSAAAIGNVSTFYRHFHLAHHRHTQDPARDPELLAQPEPRTRAQYWIRLSAGPYWLARVTQLVDLPLGRTGGRDYIHPGAWPEIVRAARWQIVFYAVVAAASLAIGTWAAVTCWLVPAFVGSPLLRAWLVVEHNGCSHDDDGFRNTRTTLTNGFARLITWNMPYHAEHHLLANVPFHKLPAAHAALREHMKVVTPGYARAHREIREGLAG